MTLQELFEISKNIVLTEKDKDMVRQYLSTTVANSIPRVLLDSTPVSKTVQ